MDIPLAMSLKDMSLHAKFVSEGERLVRVLKEYDMVRVSKRSKAEKRYSSLAFKSVVDMSGVSVSCNEHVGAFEADLIFRLEASNWKAINVEIDGPSHEHNINKMRFLGMRDRYIRETMGMEVVRVRLPTNSASRMSDAQIIKSYKDIIHSYCHL